MNCCNNQCNQGRDFPARQACELPEDEPVFPFDQIVDLTIAILAAIGVVAVIIFLGFWSAK